MSKKYQYFYLIQIQFLGFRFHGWQKQPQVKTVQQMLERQLKYVLATEEFKTLGASRTDSMVSANEFSLELFCAQPIEITNLVAKLNKCLPPDIKALNAIEVDEDFQIMGQPAAKEYLYLFSHGHKAHPFSAPFINTMVEELDIHSMQEAAKMFEGTHHFRKFSYKPTEDKEFNRTIEVAEIVTNDVLSANFFPDESYMFRVVAKGFMRYQIRMMMGFLFNIGLGQKSIDDLKRALSGEDTTQQEFIASASGLLLNKLVPR
jgi:tRNA pseudouridine38-40 synthase